MGLFDLSADDFEPIVGAPPSCPSRLSPSLEQQLCNPYPETDRCSVPPQRRQDIPSPLIQNPYVAPPSPLVLLNNVLNCTNPISTTLSISYDANFVTKVAIQYTNTTAAAELFEIRIPIDLGAGDLPPDLDILDTLPGSGYGTVLGTSLAPFIDGGYYVFQFPIPPTVAPASGVVVYTVPVGGTLEVPTIDTETGYGCYGPFFDQWTGCGGLLSADMGGCSYGQFL